MIKKMIYLRHGQTVYNVEGVWQGRADSLLSPLGIKQARVAGAHLREMDVELDHVFRSPLGRALQTLEEMDLSLAMRSEGIPGLVEMGFGEFDGKPIKGDPVDYSDFPFESFGGESDEEVSKRTCETLEEIMLRPESQNVLVVGHGASARLFCDAWAGNARVQIDGSLPNCSMLSFEFDDATRAFSLVEVWAPEVDG